MALFGDGSCRYDDFDPITDRDMYDSKTITECQNICLTDNTCIAIHVETPIDDKYVCYTYRGSGTNFDTEHLGGGNTCYRKEGTSKYK